MNRCANCRSARLDVITDDGVGLRCRDCGRTQTIDAEKIQTALSHTAPTPKANTCHICAREVRDAYVCDYCADDARQALGEIPALIEELMLVTTRQTNYAPPNDVHGKSADPPLPYQPTASDLADTIRTTLVGWTRVYLEEVSGDWPANDVRAITVLLIRRTEWFRHRPYGADFVNEIIGLSKDAQRVADTPPRTIPVGQCPDECGGEVRLTITADDSKMACDGCGQRWDTGNQQMMIGARRIMDAMLARCETGDHKWRGRTCSVCSEARPADGSASPTLLAG